MFKKNLTIKEMYEELNVTKQTIHNHIKNLVENKTISNNREKNMNGIIVLTPDEQRLIYTSITGEKPSVSEAIDNKTKEFLENSDVLRRELSYVQGQLESKERQIETQLMHIDKLYEQVKNTTTLLDQSQKLQLQIQNQLEVTKEDNKILLEYKSKNEEKIEKRWFQRLFNL